MAGPPWLVAARREAGAQLAALAWPAEAEEDWRYSGIDRFDPDRFAPVVSEGDGEDVEAAQALARQWAEALGPAVATVVTLDGRLVVASGSLAEVDGGFDGEGPAAGLQVRSGLRSAVPLRRAAALGPGDPPDAFGVLHRAFSADPVLVGVGNGRQVEGLVLVVHAIRQAPLEGVGRAVFPELRVEVGEGARLGLVEVLASLPPGGPAASTGASRNGSAVPDVAEGERPVPGQRGAARPGTDHEVAVWSGPPGGPLAVLVSGWQVAAGGQLDYGGIQALDRSASAVVFQASGVERDGRLRALTAATGAGWARVRTDAAVLGQGARSELLAGFLAQGRQVLDFRTFQDHQAPFGESELLFKGAVGDRARSVYSGLIRVRRGARGTNAYQTNHNLVLAEGARADSVPNLDIEENDVRCSHASTVGPIDEEQRYYLACRGIEPAVADRLVVRGFFGDLVSRAPIATVGAWLDRTVAARLGQAEREEGR
ncbi:SufD family Fe-S cluster assembly protein [Aciditerrimonas ferrireducens]|uniref:SufD family Fe-S cluster assembly protein n=1 Tax=Aciditerrimonas ferrireducens TaxID=667306 RepID=A0ABV6C1C0_9ACTN